MKQIGFLVAFLWVSAVVAAPPPSGAALTGEYPNLFKTYLGKTATLGGETFRIAFISKGEAFTEVGLKGEEEAP